jgi:hypothetical protein
MEIKVTTEQNDNILDGVSDVREEFVTIPMGDFLADSVASTLNIDSTEVSKFKLKIDTLIKYAKSKTDDHSPEGIKWALRNLSVKLGTPPLGEKLINYLHGYAKLYLQGKEIEEHKSRFLRGEQDD